MEWSWAWTATNETERFGDNLVFDWLRIACVAASVVLCFVIARVLLEARRRPGSMMPPQRFRFASLGLAMVSLALTEVSKVGTTATPRLVVTVLVYVLAGLGLRDVRRAQRREPPR